MKTKLTLLGALACVALGVAGCANVAKDAGTSLTVETDGLKVSYRSSKDQKLEYDPETGKIKVESKVNGELVQAAAAAQAEANKATAEVLKTVIERIPVNPANPLNPIN